MLLVNGRLFGPLELDGQSFTAGIVAHAEELELDFGPVQLQEHRGAEKSPWLCQIVAFAEDLCLQDGLVLAEDAVVKMLKQRAGSTEDYLLAFASLGRA